MEFSDFRPQAISWRRGVWAMGTGGIAVLLAFVVDADVIWAGVAALAAGLAYFAAPLSERLRYALLLTLLGAVIVGSSVGLAGSTLADALVVAGMVFVITIVQTLGLPFLTGGFLLGTVGLVAVLGAPLFDPLPAFGIYLVGGALAMALIALMSLVGDRPADAPPTGALEDALPRFIANVTPPSPAFVFSFVKATAVAVAVALAQAWFDSHWLWMVVPTFLLIVPTWALAWGATLKRLAGTLAGVAAFSLLTLVSDSDGYRILVFLAASFLALVFVGTGTVSTVTMWTVFAFSLAWMLEDDFLLTETVGERTLAVLAGSAIALLALLLLQRLQTLDTDT